MIMHSHSQKRHSHHAQHQTQQAQSSSSGVGGSTGNSGRFVPHVFSVARRSSSSNGRGHYVAGHRYTQSTNSVSVVHVAPIMDDHGVTPTSKAAKLLPFMRRTLSYKRAQRQAFVSVSGLWGCFGSLTR